MAAERLHEYTVDLCEYALAQFRTPLAALTGRPQDVPAICYRDWVRLDLPAWVGRRVAGLPGGLADHVWAGVAGDAARRPLTDAELFALEDAAGNPPMRLDHRAVWEPFPALHRRAVECVPEIREGLTRQTAEEWAAAAAGFAARLESGGLPLADGFEAVHEWVWHARRLLGVMGAIPVPPAASGSHLTPAAPIPAVPPGAPRDGRKAGGPGTRVDGGPAMLSPAQVAAGYAVSRSTVYAACRSGLLAHYRVPARAGGRGKYLVREADLLAWLESLRVAPGDPTTPSASAPASSGSPASPFSELNSERLSRAWNSR